MWSATACRRFRAMERRPALPQSGSKSPHSGSKSPHSQSATVERRTGNQTPAFIGGSFGFGLRA